MYKFHKMMQLLSRSPSETRHLKSGADRTLKMTLFWLLFLCSGAAFLPLFIQQLLKWDSFKPGIPIPRSDWHVSYDSNQTPEQTLPSDFKPWLSPHLLSDVDYISKIQGRSGQDYWLGLQIPADTIANAQAIQSNILLIGYVLGPHKVWLNGRMIHLSAGTSEAMPLMVPLPFIRPENLNIAIHAEFSQQHHDPNHLNSRSGGEGFINNNQAQSLVSRIAFWENAKPFSLFLAYALVSITFIFLWRSSSTKQEYFYMAMFALSGAFCQERWINIFRWMTTTDFRRSIDLVTNCYLAGFGLLLGLAFGRVRLGVLRVGMVTAVIFPFILLLALQGNVSTSILPWIIQSRVTPLAYLTAAAFCLLQALHIFKTSKYLKSRMKQLILFGGCLSFLATFAIFQNQQPFEYASFWQGFEHLILVLLMGGIALKDYHEQEVALRETPLSEYHRQQPLPSEVSGAVLLADLKHSEYFYRHRAKTGSEDMVGIWRSHFYTVIQKHAGLVLQKKGDELLIFFPHAQAQTALANAIHTVDEMAIVSRSLESHYRNSGSFPEESQGLHFRSSIAPGIIRPIWEQVGGKKEPYWEEAGNSTPFVHCSRLLEIESRLQKSGQATTLCIAEDTARQLPAIGTKGCFTVRDLHAMAKHDSAYIVALYEPLPKELQNVA